MRFCIKCGHTMGHNYLKVGWLASQSDMLAEDWKIVKPASFKYDF